MAHYQSLHNGGKYGYPMPCLEHEFRPAVLEHRLFRATVRKSGRATPLKLAAATPSGQVVTAETVVYGDPSAAEFEAYFRHLLSVQRRSAFYFDSYLQLSQTSERLGSFQRERLSRLRVLFEAGLRLMAEAGEIPPEGRPGAFADTAENILTVLMLRLPGEERQFAPEEQDEDVLRRAMALLGVKE